MKIINLVRSRTTDDRAQERLRIADQPLNDILQPTTNVVKKPLYRQSSMDFLKGDLLNHEKSIDRCVLPCPSLGLPCPNTLTDFLIATNRRQAS